jgi:hypothetical protein
MFILSSPYVYYSMYTTLCALTRSRDKCIRRKSIKCIFHVPTLDSVFKIRFIKIIRLYSGRKPFRAVLQFSF